MSYASETTNIDPEITLRSMLSWPKKICGVALMVANVDLGEFSTRPWCIGLVVVILAILTQVPLGP